MEICWAGDSDEELRSPELFSMSEALVGGDEARGDDFWGELPLALLLLDE